MISADQFEEIRRRFGGVASWAVWAREGATPKSNIGDLSVLDPSANPKLLQALHARCILLGLNISRQLEKPFANFHDPSPRATDFKLRFAFEGTEGWGAYMTDIIKGYEERESGKLLDYLRLNPRFERDSIDVFRAELALLRAEQQVIIALGRDVWNIARRNLGSEFRVIAVPHYAHFLSKEKYRAEVIASMQALGEPEPGG